MGHQFYDLKGIRRAYLLLVVLLVASKTISDICLMKALRARTMNADVSTALLEPCYQHFQAIFCQTISGLRSSSIVVAKEVGIVGLLHSILLRLFFRPCPSQLTDIEDLRECEHAEARIGYGVGTLTLYSSHYVDCQRSTR